MSICLHDLLNLFSSIEAALVAFGIILIAVGALRLEVGIRGVLCAHML